MSRVIKTKGTVKARSVSTMCGCKTKVEFHAENKRVAAYPRLERENVFDVNSIARFKEK